MKARYAFFHPRRTARLVNETKEEIRTLRASATADREALDAARQRIVSCEAECAKFEATVASLLDQLAAARSELDAERAFTADIEELNRRFNQLRAMQESYETRISELKEALAEERSHRRAPTLDLAQEPTPPTEEATELPPPDDDWLLPLP